MNSGLRDGTPNSGREKAVAPWLCENASRILQISALKDAGTTLKIISLSSLVFGSVLCFSK